MNLNSIIGRPRVVGWELRAAIDQALPRICSALAIQPVTLQWDNKATTASINQYGSIRLPMVADHTVISRAEIVRFVGYIVHELLHRKFTSFGVTGVGDYLARMHNAVEDVWIEREAVKAALLGNIESLLSGLIDGIVGEALAQRIDWTNPAQFPFSFAVFGRRYAGRKVPVPRNLIDIYTEASNRVDGCSSSADTLAVAQWIIDQIKQNDRQQDQDQGEQGQEGQQQGQDGQQGEGEAQGQGRGEQGQGEQQGQGQGEGQGEGQGQGEAQAPAAGQSKTLDSQHDEALQVEPGIAVQEGAPKGTFCAGNDVLPDRRHIGRSATYGFETAEVSARLQMDVRKLFANTASDDWQLHRKTGSINTRQIATGGVDMFKRRLEVSGVDSSVVILLDVSGSMFPGLIRPAGGACVALMAALDAAGVESALLTFGDGVSTVKGFSKNSKGVSPILNRIGMGGGTDDFVALSHAHSLLHARKTGRKVCFVLTDGDGRVSATRAQAISGASLGVTTIGIGIRHDVSHVYQHAVRVNTASDIGKAMFSKIKGVL